MAGNFASRSGKCCGPAWNLVVIALCSSLVLCMQFVWDFDTISLSIVVKTMETLSVSLSGLEL